MQLQPIVDLAELEAYQAVQQISQAHDYPSLPADPLDQLLPRFHEPETLSTRVERYLGIEGDQPVGVVDLHYSLLDNLTSAHLDVVVLPEQRGRGYGRALLEHGLERGQKNGRHRFFLESAVPAATHLLTQRGALVGQEALRRRLDVTAGLPARVAVPAGYRVVQYVDRAPDDLADGLAHLQHRMSTDMPLGDLALEPEVWDATRLRDNEQETIDGNRLRVSTVAVHDRSGYVAGLTDLIVNRTQPVGAEQWATIVDPDHRGHGLGLVVKSWNHHHLAATSPTTAFVNTWNAASNTFMIRVNEQLGFQVMERWTEWQLDV
jgi:GNAT superfamily N-acetyltransferase